MPDEPRHAATDGALVDAFVRRHFSLRGTLRLHRNALGLDLLRAPVNVMLSPLFFLMHVMALVLRLVRLRRAARWLSGRQILLRPDVARVLEAAIRDELLAPRSRALPSPAQMRLIEGYSAVRNAVAEITTTVFVVLAGLAIFHTPTPGIFSLAPLVSRERAEAAAISQFPLGQRLGGAWYGVFPVELPAWYIVAVGVTLAIAASVVTTFAGVLADPLQTALGIHRRRLLRLLAALDRAEEGEPGLAREHILARMADITDAGLSLLRALR